MILAVTHQHQQVTGHLLPGSPVQVGCRSRGLEFPAAKVPAT